MIFLINNDTETITKLQDINDEYKLDHLIIKFYRTYKDIIKNNKEYTFFFEQNHKIKFNFL